MAYDEQLAARLRTALEDEPGLTEKKMFGGLAFLIEGNMAVAASGQGGVLVRVDPVQTDTLLETTNEGWGVKVETKDSEGERWLVTEPRRFVRAPPDIHHSGAKLETLGTETITIEGVAYECVKRKSVVRTEAFSWTHEKHGVLKSESGGKTMLVTRLSVRLAVAGKELECRETRTSSLGGTVVVTALHSAAVPGGVARSQLDSRKDGVGTRQVTEVLAFGTP